MGIDVSCDLDRIQTTLNSVYDKQTRFRALAILERWRHDGQLLPECAVRAARMFRTYRYK